MAVFSWGDLLWRFYYFTKELLCNRKKHNDIYEIRHIFFSGCEMSIIIILFQLMYCFVNGISPFATTHNAIPVLLFYLVHKWKCDNSLFHRIKMLRDSHGLDKGTSMAEGFYHGYLSIILPNRGDGNKGLKERIGDFEDKEGVEIPVKRLFLLLPEDLYCPPLISDKTSNMRKIDNLEFILRDRAGTTARHYSNTVYKLITKKCYVVAEEATPLLTFYESQRNNCDDDMKYLIREVFEKFYQTLRNLIEKHQECHDLIVFIPYKSKNAKGESTDIAKLLADAIDKYSH